MEGDSKPEAADVTEILVDIDEEFKKELEAESPDHVTKTVPEADKSLAVASETGETTKVEGDVS